QQRHEGVVAELHADVGLGNCRLEQAVGTGKIALDEFGHPLAERAPHVGMRSDGVGERLERCLREMLLVEPLQDRPVLEYVVRRRDEQRVIVRRRVKIVATYRLDIRVLETSRSKMGRTDQPYA